MQGLAAAEGASPVCLPDHASLAFAGSAELVFEFADAPLAGGGVGGAGVALGGELAGGGSEAGEPGDQLGAVGSVDLGAELQAAPAAELVPFGAKLADLVPGDGEGGAQAGLGPRLAAGWRGGGPRTGVSYRRAAPGGIDVRGEPDGGDHASGRPGGGRHPRRGDPRPRGFLGFY